MSQIPLHVVIIDDSPGDRELIRLALLNDLERQFVFYEAENGRQGLKIVQTPATKPPDVMLLDLRLPDMHGLEFLQTFKGRSEIVPIPVVVLTETPYSDEASAALAIGAQDFIAKSQINSEILPRVVINAIERFNLVQRLHKSEERLRMATEVGEIGIWDMDLLTQTRNWSDRGKAIYGLAPDEVLDYERQLSLIHPDDRAYVHDIVTRFRDHATLDKIELQHRIVRPDGETRWVAVRGEASHIGIGAERRPARLIGTIIDITERVQTEEALRQSEAQLRALAETLEQRVVERTAELERRNQELDQFAYIASHDLKRPLRNIDNLASWISEDSGGLLPETSQRHLELLRGRVKRMEGLLNGLLAYSRADRYYGTAERIDTGALIADIVALLAPPDSFKITTQADMPTFVTVCVPLETVLRNLIDNAIKHHHRSDGHIQISAQEKDGYIEFAVSDDGPGIPEAFHERIFGIFETLKPQDQVEGNGMGLAIVKKTVESRGGVIKVISAEGQGATFCFTWPKGALYSAMA